MKKLFAFITVFGMLMMGASFVAVAQDEAAEESTEVVDEIVDTVAVEEVVAEETMTEEVVAEEDGGLSVLHKNIKTKFIEGGASFMGAVLLALIFGLAFAFERIIYLGLATTDTDKLLKSVEDALESGGVDAAKEV